jgi:hypothetical protein
LLGGDARASCTARAYCAARVCCATRAFCAARVNCTAGARCYTYPPKFGEGLFRTFTSFLNDLTLSTLLGRGTVLAGLNKRLRDVYSLMWE